LRLAIIQPRAVYDDPAATIAVTLEHWRAASALGARLILFPEAWLLGHAYDAPVIHARAASMPPLLERLCDASRALPATAIVGAFEAIDGWIFNNALIIEAGRIKGRYAKSHPNEDGVTPGVAMPVFDGDGRRYAINICNDANHPATAARAVAAGADLLLYPLNNMLPATVAERWRSRSVDNLVDRARETGCWIASSDVTGEAGERVAFGCTMIVRPDGTIATRVPEGEVGMAIHDLPLAS
jgi:predicted amidohydrolase